MLLELTIRQFAIIKELKVQFKDGLNILTGETGAGKSIIIDAIQLITGGRGSVEFIRSGSDKAEIEALFDLTNEHQVYSLLEEFGIDSGEGMLLLRRDILKSGKSVCRINGHLVTLAMLKEVGKFILHLHSQHQHQHLLSSEKQLALLDAYGLEEIEPVKERYQASYQTYDSLRKESNRLIENEKEVTHRIDLLQYQIKEIKNASLKDNEDQDLMNQKEKMKHAEKISKSLKQAHTLLNEENGIVDLLSSTVSSLEHITGYDQNLANLYEQLAGAFYQVEDVALQLGEQMGTIDFSTDEINEVEERLALIHQLKRKYGENVTAILEYADTIEQELDVLLNREEHLLKVQKALMKATKQVINDGQELSNVRKKYAENLSKVIEDELKDLQMPNSKFKVELIADEHKDGIEIDGKYYRINVEGMDQINYLISPNPGEPLKPINKIASGGELSRIMLAIQTILASQDDISTIIFDEVDTGVSGRAAQAIAEKLALVARGKQVFVITHLPQVASMADTHYLIEKKIDKDYTYTQIIALNEENRINELARMLGGAEVTSLTKKHAEEMIKKAIPVKKN